MKKILKVIALVVLFSISKTNVSEAKEVQLTKDMLDFIKYELVNDGEYIYKKPKFRVEKRIAEAKGFAYDRNTGIIQNRNSNDNYPINEGEIKAIDEWAKWVFKESGASQQKTQRAKALYIAAYLKTVYRYKNYDDEEGYNKVSQIRSIPYEQEGNCLGFSYILVRILDVIGIESYATSSNYNGDGHSVVRAYLDGKWTTIEATGHVKYYNHLDDVRKGYTKNIFISPIKYIYNYEEILYDKTKTGYVIFVNKEIENYLSKHNLKIFGY